MSAPKKESKLGTIHANLMDTVLDLLKGEPVFDKEGQPIFVEGKLLMRKPSAAVIREVRELLKDHNIDEEAVEGSKVMEVAKAARRYDDEADPFLIPDPKQNQGVTKSTL